MKMDLETKNCSIIYMPKEYWHTWTRPLPASEVSTLKETLVTFSNFLSLYQNSWEMGEEKLEKLR